MSTEFKALFMLLEYRTILVSDERGYYQVRCLNCGFCKDGGYYYPKELAIAVWNNLQEDKS